MEMIAASAATIFLLVLQQQNVTHHWYFSAAANAYAIAFAQYHMFVFAAHGTGSWLEMGTGGAIGGLFAMFTHKRIREFRENVSAKRRERKC